LADAVSAAVASCFTSGSTESIGQLSFDKECSAKQADSVGKAGERNAGGNQVKLSVKIPKEAATKHIGWSYVE
jgi:hypothetical protein